MNNNNKTIEKLVDEIIRIVDKKIANLYSDKEAIIVSQNENSYTVLIDSYKYNVKNGTKTINIEFSSIPNYIQENISYITNEEIDALFNKRRWINATRFYFKPKWTRPFIE